jgi:hypothetical protein
MMSLSMHTTQPSAKVPDVLTRDVACFMGGAITNKLGTKWAFVLGAMAFPIRGSSLL